MRAAFHATRAPDRSRFPGAELPYALPLRFSVLPSHARRQAAPVSLPARGGGRPARAELRRHLAVGAAVSPAARGRAGREVRRLRIPHAVRRLPRARVRARGGRPRRRSVMRLSAAGGERHGPHCARTRGRVRRRLHARSRVVGRGARAHEADSVVRAGCGDTAGGGMGAPPRTTGSDARAARGSAQRDADRLFQEATLLRGRQRMTDSVLLLQAAADSTHAYGEFPVIGARAFVWITAEVHLMFAAFVLGVPMFAVVTEAIGIFGGDERYDRLSKEFTRLLLVAYSATAIW